MNVKINLEVNDKKELFNMEGTPAEMMAVLTMAMCRVLAQTKRPGVSNYQLACDVAGGVRMGLDHMDKEGSTR